MSDGTAHEVPIIYRHTSAEDEMPKEPSALEGRSGRALVTPAAVAPGRYKPPDAVLAFLEAL